MLDKPFHTRNTPHQRPPLDGLTWGFSERISSVYHDFYAITTAARSAIRILCLGVWLTKAHMSGMRSFCMVVKFDGLEYLIRELIAGCQNRHPARALFFRSINAFYAGIA
jgi:hypothetical protein